MDAHPRMSRYDESAWLALARWRKQFAGSGRESGPGRVRASVRAAGSSALQRLEALPGARRFDQLFTEALRGLTDFGARTARASIRTDAVVRAYQKRGYTVHSLADVRALGLADIDRVKPRLDLAYIAASTAEGAAAGLAVSGGQLLAGGGAVAGTGAGAAPGAATVLGLMAADAAAVLVAGQRVVAHVAAYYGYDLNDSSEQLFAAAALNVGTATPRGKAAAYVELNKVVQGLARAQTWQQLSRHTVTRVVEQVYNRLGMRLTRRKLAQALPALGIVLGAGLNARLLAKVHDDAEHLYRERFLKERYGLTAVVEPVALGTEDHVPMSEIIDAGVVDAEVVDAEVLDTGVVDAGVVDAEVLEAETFEESERPET